MRKLILATIIAASTAAHADMSNLMKLQAGVALGKQALDAAKVLQPTSQPADTKARGAPPQGSIEQMCVTAINGELASVLSAHETENDLKKAEARLQNFRLSQKLTTANDPALASLPKTIEETNQRLDKQIAEVSRAKLNRERVCAGLVN